MDDQNAKEILLNIVNEFNKIFIDLAGDQQTGSTEQIQNIQNEAIRLLLKKKNATSAYLFLLISKSGSPEYEFHLFKKALMVYDNRKNTRQALAQKAIAEKKQR